MLLGEGLVGVNHRAIPTSTHKEDTQKSTSCNKFVTQLLPYVHATGLANFNKSISQFHNHPLVRLPHVMIYQFMMNLMMSMLSFLVVMLCSIGFLVTIL